MLLLIILLSRVVLKLPESGRRHEREPQPQTSLVNPSLCTGRVRLRPASPRGTPAAPEPQGKPRQGVPDPHTQPCAAQDEHSWVPDQLWVLNHSGVPAHPALPQSHPSRLKATQRQRSIPRPGRSVGQAVGGL